MEALGRKDKLRYFLPTLWRLGPANVLTVAIYRLALKSGFIEKLMPRGTGCGETFFDPPRDLSHEKFSDGFSRDVLESAEDLTEGKVILFSRTSVTAGSPPDWFCNWGNGRRFADASRHWSTLGDFDKDIGDIKNVWELSRFDWALVLARAFCVSHEPRFLRTLNHWVADWTLKNPPNTGPNWKCGQEAGIRLLQILLAAYLLRCHDSPSIDLMRFIEIHCARIGPTIRYAMAQDNNHGTSEAAALFVGGGWLEKFSPISSVRKKARRWHVVGRRWLENRVGRLIEKDGSFSQYSLNYHRLLVDTLNIVEFWRRELKAKSFSSQFYGRVAKAVEWLYHMVDSESGDAPNLGSNDGARLFVLSSTKYRDYRPTVQLGAVLFGSGPVFGAGQWNEPLYWLEMGDGEGTPSEIPRKSLLFPDGGYVVFRPESSENSRPWGVLKYPRYRFRPAHEDGFHLDLWHRGVNILRDSGSYSYHTEEPWQSYFSSPAAHNAVQFDDRNQMPRLSRFLFGAWPRLCHEGELRQDSDGIAWEGTFRDYRGASHRRRIEISRGRWRIFDEIGGFENNAVLRWRLAPAAWRIVGSRCLGELAEIELACNREISRLALVEGWESRYYGEKTPIPVLELQVASGENATIMTDIYFNS